MKSNPLDLYAKIEPMIGFYEAYEHLYEQYLLTISPLSPQKILDVGCGNGRLLELLGKSGWDAVGIDLSSGMVEKSRSRGVDAHCQNLNGMDDTYDMILSVADVLNYMDNDQLTDFLQEVNDHLIPGGYFLADINTHYGFEEVAAGTMIADQESSFLAIDAIFEEEILTTDMTLFTQENSGYQKETGRIMQYYHPTDSIAHPHLILQQVLDIRLFSEDEPDKILLVFQKETDG